ncbi:hypothetical protein TrLO_g14273 [Triparma laevis f. longispina]|uniref:Uncharacterized protein n=1 Tax=Triparma laevis f. longispina TaxID=1714387 RepID=A0A9W7F2Q6_9STRA|nr:hypothetical protein TrLO_g14273 [Triparma laevis f. longispina]
MLNTHRTKQANRQHNTKTSKIFFHVTTKNAGSLKNSGLHSFANALSFTISSDLTIVNTCSSNSSSTPPPSKPRISNADFHLKYDSSRIEVIIKVIGKAFPAREVPQVQHHMWLNTTTCYRGRFGQRFFRLHRFIEIMALDLDEFARI